MSLSDLASLGSFVSGFGVLASLVYLALQVRRAEKYQKALMQVERAKSVGDHMRFLADPAVIGPFMKGSLGVPDITVSEYLQSTFIFSAALASIEDSFFQHQHKLLDEASFESVLGALKRTFCFPGTRATWKRQRMNYDKSFRDFMDQMLGGVEVVGLAYGMEELANWHRDVAAELAKVRA